MKIQIFKFNTPHPFIQEIREIMSDKRDDTLTHFVPPFGCPEIIFYIGNEKQIKNTTCKNGFLKGQYNTAQKIDFNPDYHFLSISLHPYGLKQLFNFKATELLNAVIDIEEHPITISLLDLFQNRKNIDISLVEQLTQKVSQLPAYSISKSTKEFIKAVEQTEEHTVQNIIKDKGIGLRTLQRNFKNDVGFTPKEFLRIVRMNKIEQRLTKNTNIFQIIADFDFTDQSHLVKEFKQWRNFTPKELLKKKLLLSDQLPISGYFHL
ncbi:MAG TPA: helix-turn-helix domain-containing protein [Flavobacteriaceae bacterium]|nr:helix-turn-helix domain-containing protein [Flavobacteriaceae bacterium]